MSNLVWHRATVIIAGWLWAAHVEVTFSGIYNGLKFTNIAAAAAAAISTAFYLNFSVMHPISLLLY
jgi:hypothetical protein